MKKSLIIFFLFIVSSIQIIYGQNQPSIYIEALEKHIASVKTFDKDQMKLYVKEVSYLGALPNVLNGLSLETISNDDLKRYTKKVKNFPLTIVNPVEIDNNELFIYVTFYQVSRKRKHYKMESQYASQIKLVYSCKEKKYRCELIN